MRAFIFVPSNSTCDNVAPKVGPPDSKYLSPFQSPSTKLNIQVAGLICCSLRYAKPVKQVGSAMVATSLKSTSIRVENFPICCF